jgi:hypothetical protein
MSKTHEIMLTILEQKGNANPKHTKSPPHSCLEWLPSRTPTITNVVEDVGKRNPHG